MNPYSSSSLWQAKAAELYSGGLLLCETLLAGTGGAELILLLLSMESRARRGWGGTGGAGGGRHTAHPVIPAGLQALSPGLVPQAWTEFLYPKCSQEKDLSLPLILCMKIMFEGRKPGGEKKKQQTNQKQPTLNPRLSRWV